MFGGHGSGGNVGPGTLGEAGGGRAAPRLGGRAPGPGPRDPVRPGTPAAWGPGAQFGRLRFARGPGLQKLPKLTKLPSFISLGRQMAKNNIFRFGGFWVGGFH